MTIKKTDIADRIAEADGGHKSQALETVETLLEIIKSTLEAGEDVLVSGFGKFRVKEKSKRLGRNPATGTGMMLRARRVVTFKCSGKLRNRMNPGQQRKSQRQTRRRVAPAPPRKRVYVVPKR